VPPLVPIGCQAPKATKKSSNGTVGGVVLRVNLQTSVGGFATFELQHGGGGDVGDDVDGEGGEEGECGGGCRLRAGEIRHTQGKIYRPPRWWQGQSCHAKTGHTNPLSGPAGKWAQVKVVLTDADLKRAGRNPPKSSFFFLAGSLKSS
jgi:hypothetical protein